MNATKPLSIILLLLLASLSSSILASQQTFFETVGPYGTGYYDSSQFQITSRTPYGEWAQIGISTLSFTIQPYATNEFYPSYSIEFSTIGTGDVLKVGNYFNTERFPFASPGHPQMFMSDYCCGLDMGGGFTVYDATIGSSGLIEHFAASFYFGESQNPYQYGKIWYNSDAKVVPLPNTLWLFSGAVFCLFKKRRLPKVLGI
ncbi:MAG: hypothetical protein ABL925_12260 [Methylococcales bacterium]